MTTSIFFIIMFAAVLHASWNAILKRGEDKRLQMTAIAVGHLPFAPIAIYFAPSLDLACWPYLVLGAIFHLGYQYYLVESYKKGDLSQVYPIARASAPLLVTCISALFLNVNLNFVFVPSNAAFKVCAVPLPTEVILIAVKLAAFDADVANLIVFLPSSII